MTEDDGLTDTDIDEIISRIRHIRSAQGGMLGADEEDCIRTAARMASEKCGNDIDEFIFWMGDYREQLEGVNKWLACRRVVKHTVRLMREEYVRWKRMRGGAYKWKMIRNDGGWGDGKERVRFNPPLHRQESVNEGRLSFREFVESRQPLKTFLKNYTRRDGDSIH